MPITWSPLAKPARHIQQPAPRKSPTPWGVCVHTTGSGVLTAADAHRVAPLEAALSIYCAPGAFHPHYVIDSTGEVAQVCDELLRAPHCGLSPENRDAYASGGWVKRVAATPLAAWRVRWNGKRSPLDLFPSGAANDAYLGIELIPSRLRTPNATLFTDAQYIALARLLEDVESRWSIKLTGSRLVGHEDINPIERWNTLGGWDPGSLQSKPSFRWDLVHTGALAK